MTQRAKQDSATPDEIVFGGDPTEGLTIEEIELFEDTVEESIEDAFADGRRRGRPLRVLAWIVRRRDDPDFTLEQAGKLRIRIDEDAGVGPTGAAG